MAKERPEIQGQLKRTPMNLDRAAFEALDRVDPLAHFRGRFSLPRNVIYLDGNSLGALPRSTPRRLATLSRRSGAAISSPRGTGTAGSRRRSASATRSRDWSARGPARVVVAESTSINLFKVLAVALKMRPGRRVIVSEADNFPTDLYMLRAWRRCSRRGTR
jgi:kynureninase